MNGIHPTSRTRRTALTVLLCAAAVFLQSVAMPFHAASHFAPPAPALSADHPSLPTHSHDPGQPSHGDCDLCNLLSQTADGNSAPAPVELTDLLQILTYLRGPVVRPMPTRLVLNDISPRGPPQFV